MVNKDFQCQSTIGKQVVWSSFVLQTWYHHRMSDNSVKAWKEGQSIEVFDGMRNIFDLTQCYSQQSLLNYTQDSPNTNSSSINCAENDDKCSVNSQQSNN